MNYGGCLYFFHFSPKKYCDENVSKNKIFRFKYLCGMPQWFCLMETMQQTKCLKMSNQNANEDTVVFCLQIIECLLLLPLKQQQPQLKVAKSC